MTKPSARARAAVRDYRRTLGSGEDRHERVWNQIVATLDSGSQPEAAAAVPGRRRRPIVVAVSIALVASAAAVVLAILVPALGRPRSEATPMQVPHETSRDRHPDHVIERRTAATPSDSSVTIIDDEVVAPHGIDTSPVEAVVGRPRPRASPRESNEVATEDRLRAEIVLLARAREALRNGSMARSLGLLDAYAREFPSGQLLEDALILRVEALCAAGKEQQARAEAKEFLRKHPRSAHTALAARGCPDHGSAP